MMETNSIGLSNSVRLHLRHLKTGLVFLVDSEADVSVLPRPKDWKADPIDFKLHAANDTAINVHGIITRTLSFIQNRVLDWQFYVADVPHPILGADALAHFHLLPDLRNRTLVDSFGQVYGRGIVANASSSSVSLVADSHPLQNLLKQFPTVIGIVEPLDVPKENRVFIESPPRNHR